MGKPIAAIVNFFIGITLVISLAELKRQKYLIF
jgi:hypothetical protein